MTTLHHTHARHRPAAPRVARPTIDADRLALLLGVTALGCLATLIATKALVGPAAYAAAAAAAGVLGLVAFRVLDVRRETAAAAPPGTGGHASTFKTTKRVLLLMMVAGVVVYVGGGGTFGSFSAETTNPSNSAASGTLTMSNDANSSATACVSNNPTYGVDNVNSHCDAVLTPTNLAPGVFSNTDAGTVTVKNTGSIDASKLFLWAPPNSTTLDATSGALTYNGSVSSLTVSALTGAITGGQSIVVSGGTGGTSTTQTFIAGAAGAAIGATSIPLNASTQVNANYAGGSPVNVVDCYDQVTTTSPVGGATTGQDLNFNPTTGNPFCGTALLYVQETTGSGPSSAGDAYCWVGQTYSSAPTNGMCIAPISVTLSSQLNSGTSYSALPVNALNGNVLSGDTITVTSGTSTQTFTAGADAYAGETSIQLNTSTAATTTFPAATSTVVDTSTLGTLNSGGSNTISNFDTLHNGSQGEIELSPVTSAGTLDTSGVTPDLSAGGSRTFLVGVYFPSPTGQNQNAVQGLFSTFGITWHIDQ